MSIRFDEIWKLTAATAHVSPSLEETDGRLMLENSHCFQSTPPSPTRGGRAKSRMDVCLETVMHKFISKCI